jgi:hypothetical protein
MTRLAQILYVLVVGCLSGCTHVQLRRSTISQEGTLSELQIIQVLDNVAAFCDNDAALPFFALSSTGSAQVSDQGNASGAPNWNVAGMASGGFNLGANRTVTEQWGLVPVLDPHKLRLMRCAYQCVVGGDGDGCDDCWTELSHFYGPDFNPVCQLPRGWFCFGSKREIPKDACYVGRHCNTYAWVTHDGMPDLARFTMTILEIAVTAPYAPPTHTETEKQYDAEGRLIKEITRQVPDTSAIAAHQMVAPNVPPRPAPRQTFVPMAPPSIQFFPAPR